MENFIGWILMAMVLAIPVLIVYVGYKMIKNHKKQTEDLEKQFSSGFEYAKFIRSQDRASRLNLAKPTPAKMAAAPAYYVPPKNELPIGSKYKAPVATPSATSSNSNDSLLTDLATLYVLNSALQHGSASAKVDYDSGSIKTDNSSSSSWGLDDDDSRRSASSSFSSSDSSSSWDSSSSSSNSGPSSDW